MKRAGLVSAAMVFAIAAGSISIRAGEQAGAGATAQRPAAAAGHSDSHTFVNEAAIAGMAEVQLGKLAIERAANAEVKAFGQMMVKDHSQANENLKQVASQLKMQLPTQLDQKHRDLAARLSKLKGAEFDREYVNAMVQGHEEVLAKLQARAGNQLTSAEPGGAARPGAPGAAGAAGAPPAGGGRPPAAGAEPVGTGGQGEQALTQWAAKGLPRVQHHLEQARALQQKVAK